MAPASTQLISALKQAAHDVGFELCGISPVADFPEFQKFSEWIEAGRAGEMKYMEARDDKGNLKRSSLCAAFPWARSAVVCAINYNTASPRSIENHDQRRGWISRYAWGQEDYHDAALRKLRELDGRLISLVAGFERDSTPGRELSSSPVPLQTRCYVDTGPISERTLAKYSGVGWIGKNTCLIHPKIGSWIFLGVILTSLDLQPDAPLPDRCGTCTRCIDACPTDALIAPYQLDANLCISYLTIEKRSEIPEPLREGIGRNVFGCDICQDVCPWNRKAPVTSAPEFQPREGTVNPDLEWLAQMSQEEFRQRFRGSPVKRTKWEGLRRNTLVAMGNSGELGFLPIVERLCQDANATISAHAKWAKDKILAFQTSDSTEELTNQRGEAY